MQNASPSAESGTGKCSTQKVLASEIAPILATVQASRVCSTCEVDRSRILVGCVQAQTASACSTAEAATLTNESAMAMPAEAMMPSALDLSKEWLCDSGAAYDLVSQDMADPYPDYQASAKPVNFHTANGVHRSETTLSMSTPALGAEESRAYIMEKSPSALSVGQRVMNKGYSFVWIKGKKPCFILPREGVAVTSVRRNCPYYDKDTTVYEYDDERLPDLCGI